MSELDKYKKLLEGFPPTRKEEGEPLPPFADQFRERAQEVIMNDAKMIEIGPDDETKTIGTSSLGGCLAIVAVVEDPNGKRRCGLAHYDPMGLRLQYTPEQALLRELERKKAEGGISDDEEAELSGLRIFPKNSRAAELRKKEALKTITDEEREELRQFYLRQNEGSAMDPTITNDHNELESIQNLFSSTSAMNPRKLVKSSVIIMITKTDDPFIEAIKDIAKTKLGCSDVHIIQYGNHPSDRLDVTVPNHKNGSPSFSTATEGGSLNW
jgi:hypothetical protein